MTDVPKTDARGAPLRLRDDFAPVATSEWQDAARQDLKGADYDRRLVWRTDEGVTVQPFYRREHLEGLEAQTTAVPGAFPFVRGDTHPWSPASEAVFPPEAIRADRLHDAGATAVQELAFAIAEGIDRLAAQTNEDRSVDEVARALSFVFAVGSTYFVEIAKLRAARLLWATAVSAFAPSDPGAAAIRVHVRTARANKSTCDAYTNLLRVTTEAMAAVIGGADTVVVEAHGFDPHLATNVQRILAEEAHLGAVADAAGGAYYVEALTDALAREAWALVQRVEAEGGYATAVAAGTVRQAIEASRAARQKAVALRRRTLVGVNNYPNLTEKQPAAGPAPAPDPGGPAPPLRLAEPFERIRDRTARHALRIGRCPRVLLLTRGDVKMRMARANFSLNFFGCAGFDVAQSDSLEEWGEGADLVVLCSADSEYLDFARDVVPRTTAPVVVAGNPKDLIEALTAVGVQGFVHVQTDAVQALTEWQNRLGMLE